jgi:hypothetical protein
VEQKVDIFGECDMIRVRAILIGYSSGSGGGLARVVAISSMG